jgi:hypothetical protein
MAGDKLRTQGLTAWETYTNGSYRQFMGGGSKGVRKNASTLLEELLGKEVIPGEKGGFGLGKPENPAEAFKNSPLGKIPGAFGKFFEIIDFLGSAAGWVRIGKVLLGVFLLLTGVLGMANIQTGDTVIKTATKAGELAVA